MERTNFDASTYSLPKMEALMTHMRLCESAFDTYKTNQTDRANAVKMTDNFTQLSRMLAIFNPQPNSPHWFDSLNP